MPCKIALCSASSIIFIINKKNTFISFSNLVLKMASGLLFPPAQGMAVLHSDTETTAQENTLRVPSRRPLCMRSRTTRRRRSSSKSSSLDTMASLSSFTSHSIVSSPNIVITRRGSLSRSQPVFTFSPRGDVAASKTTKSKTRSKRRIRTFYSNGLWTFDFSKKRRCSSPSTVRKAVDHRFPTNPVLPPCGPPSPSPIPMMDRHHLSVDQFGEALSYDSAASNMAANNDLDRHMADDEDDDEFSDLEVPDLPTKRDSEFKIVVSAPDCGFDSRMTAKRARLRFCGSDLDCATDDCGSSDDEVHSLSLSVPLSF